MFIRIVRFLLWAMIDPDTGESRKMSRITFFLGAALALVFFLCQTLMAALTLYDLAKLKAVVYRIIGDDVLSGVMLILY